MTPPSLAQTLILVIACGLSFTGSVRGQTPQPEGGQTKYDKPSRADEDFAIDEERDKRIRGNEAPKDVADPD